MLRWSSGTLMTSTVSDNFSRNVVFSGFGGIFVYRCIAQECTWGYFNVRICDISRF